MKKVIELLIKKGDLETLGVDICSLVENPAIGVNFFAFSEQEFVDPDAGEELEPFMGRCIPTLINEGYEVDQAVSVCSQYWEDVNGPTDFSDIKLTEEQLDLYSDQVIRFATECGTEFDPLDTIFIDTTNENFADGVGAIGKAISVLDILTKRDAKRDAITVYRYEGPRDSKTRKLCRALLDISENKVFEKSEIETMAADSPAIANNVIPKKGTSASSYNLFKYAAGAQCRHKWVEYKMFKDENNKTVFIKTGYSTKKGKDHGDNGYTSAAAREASRLGYLKYYWSKNKKKFNKMDFSVLDDDQQIVVGPAMIPSSLIPRREEDGTEYFVFFSKETIKEIAQKFFKLNFQNNTDVNHDDNVTQENTLLESWIVEDTNLDKSRLYGYEPIPGTWFLSYKINNSDTWAKIKRKELRGFSISGSFTEDVK